MVVSAESKEESTADESIVEELVVLRLPQTGNLQTSSATHFRLIGLKEGKPFLQVGNEVFQGTFEKPLGTILLFGNQEFSLEDTSNQEDENARPSSWGLIGYTEETIEFEKVQLRKKNTGPSQTQAEDSEGQPSSHSTLQENKEASSQD